MLLKFISDISVLLNIVSTKNKKFLISCDAAIVKILVYGDELLDLVTKTLILNASADFILSS